MIFTATVATKFKKIFDDKLLVKCLEWLFQTTNRAGDLFALVMETKKNFPGASLDILHQLLRVGNETYLIHPSAIFFLKVYTILHDIWVFDTIITRY